MARGDGELLSGLGNLIGAVTNTIERKNDQNFQLRREDTMTRLQTERDNLLMQTQAMLQEREANRQRQMQLQTEASRMGLNVKDKLADTGALGNVLNLSERTLNESVRMLEEGASVAMGNIEMLDSAMADYNRGAKGFAINNKEWGAAMESGGSLTVKEAKDLFRMQFDMDPEENEFMFQGFLSAATDKEAFDRAMLTEAELTGRKLDNARKQLDLDNYHVFLAKEQAQIEAFKAQARAENMRNLTMAQEYNAKNLQQSRQLLADGIGSMMQIPLMTSVQAALVDTETADPKVRMQNAMSIVANYIGPEGSHGTYGIQTVESGLRMQFVGDVVNRGTLEKFVNYIKNSPEHSNVYKNHVLSFFAEGVVDQSGTKGVVLKNDIGGNIMDLAIAADIWARTGKVVNDPRTMQTEYYKWAKKNEEKAYERLYSEVIQSSTNPEALARSLENFGMLVHSDRQKAGGIRTVTEMIYQDLAREHVRLTGPKGALNKNHFDQLVNEYAVIGNVVSKKGQDYNTPFMLPTLMLATDIMGTFDAQDPSNSTSLINASAIIQGMGNVKLFANITPEMTKEYNNTGESLQLTALEDAASFIGDRTSRFARSEYASVVSPFLSAAGGLQSTAYRMYDRVPTYISNPDGIQPDNVGRGGMQVPNFFLSRPIKLDR